MCVNCFSSIDTVGVSVGGALGLAASAVGRVRDATAGLSVADRRFITWHQNATFVTRLGLDPALVLGPPPSMWTPSSQSPPVVGVVADVAAPTPVCAQPELVGTRG